MNYYLKKGEIMEKELQNTREESTTESSSESQASPTKRFLTLAEVEKAHIQKALTHFKENKTRVAKALGISNKTLYNKLHEYDIFVRADDK